LALRSWPGELFPAKNIVNETKKALKEKNEVVKEYGLTLMDVEKRAIGSLEDGLVGLISGTKSASAAFKDMARSIVNDMIRMQIQQSITAPLFNMMNSGGPPISTASGFTSVGPAAGVSSGGSAPIVFEGGGFTGMGGRSGGIDGRGGFPAILHPNETVIDHTKGQGGGVTVNLNISTGVSQTVRAEIANLLPQITQATKSAVADARMRGGSFSGAMGV